MLGHDTFMAQVEGDRTELLLRYPFFGRVICQCELVPVQSPNAPVACNDCRRIYLSESAYTALPPEDRLPVLAHEVLHITLRHAFRCGNRDEERFSFAADAEIYPLLRDEFPQAAMRGYRKAWDGLTAEEIYELLPKKLPEVPPRHCYPSNTPSKKEHADVENMDRSDDRTDHPLDGDGSEDDSGNASSGSDADGACADNPDGREGNVPGEGGVQGGDGAQGRSCAQGEDGNGGNAGNGQGGDPGNDAMDPEPASGNESSGTTPQPSFDADSEMFCQNLSAEAQNDLKMRSGRGEGTGKLLRLLEKVNASHIDWKSLLRQFIREVRGGSYRWLPPNRRFISKGLYLPGRRQKMFRGVVALDTSGSTAEALPDFVSEAERLMRSFGKFELTVIECDASIGNVTVVSSDTRPHDWRKHRFSGGGGTDFAPVFKYIKDKRLTPDVLVFFTDGDGACPRANPG